MKKTKSDNYPASTQRLYNVSFRAYLRYVMYERLHNVVTAFANERCFKYVCKKLSKNFQIFYYLNVDETLHIRL